MEVVFFCQAEDGIRDLVRSRGLGDVYKRQIYGGTILPGEVEIDGEMHEATVRSVYEAIGGHKARLLYTSDAADERSSVDLGGRRII